MDTGAGAGVGAGGAGVGGRGPAGRDLPGGGRADHERLDDGAGGDRGRHIPPEPDPENVTEQADVTSEWVPVVEDPRHPFWQNLREQEQLSEQERDSQQ